MTSVLPETSEISIRPLQRRDLEEIERLCRTQPEFCQIEQSDESDRQWSQIQRWFGLVKCLSLFRNPLQHLFSAYVAEHEEQVRGMIQISPFNRTRSTWKVDQVVLGGATAENGHPTLSMDVGSQLLRYCFQTIWEARTWLIEVNINDKDTLALYRHNGFQPLAHLTYWAIAPEILKSLAEREPDLPNLLPVSNADATLLHQLDTVSMPPLVRQVFDRHVLDFKTGLPGAVIDSIKHRVNRTEVANGYVFEPQRKAAIGHYHLDICRDGSRPHTAQLTVHPAYTWLYPELMAQMAQVVQNYPDQVLQVNSTDYQPEREEYLERVGATRTEHSLLMSRSVWHKLRESKPVSLEGLQLSDVLQSLQPSRKPVPGRFSFIDSTLETPNRENGNGNGNGKKDEG